MNTMNNGKRPYTNYSASKPQSPVVEKEAEAKEEVVAEPVVEKEVEAAAPVEIERVDDIAEEVKNVLRVIPELLNVRVAPNANAPITGQLKKGATVHVLEYVDDFAKIGDNEYVKSKFLD